MADVYRFRVEGVLSPEMIETFDPVRSEVDHGHTVFLCAVADQAALFGVLARCELLGLRLVELARDLPAAATTDTMLTREEVV